MDAETLLQNHQLRWPRHQGRDQHPDLDHGIVELVATTEAIDPT